jgi:hypothetical protein
LVTGRFARKLHRVFLTYQLAIEAWCEVGTEPFLPNLLTFNQC